jgi:hypothetical protein
MSSDLPGVFVRVTPFLPTSFLLVAEGLSRLLKQSRQSSHLQGIKVAPMAPTVNHLLFADDSLLFLTTSAEGAMEVKEILEKHCNTFRHHVNLDKYYVFLSKGCPDEKRLLVKNILNVATEY